ncbi:MAG: PRC-barrel domain-containing protein [Planctomycetota bacterium]
MKIHSMKHTIPTVALMLACSAGLALPAMAQSASTDRDRKQTQNQINEPRASVKAARVYNFQRLSTLMGSEVIDRDGTEVASIDDLVLDRGSGEVSHVVTVSNDILGLGGDRFAIPYEEFSFDPNGRLLTLDLTTQQVESFGEQSPDAWVRIESGDVDASLQMIKRASQDKPNADTIPWRRMLNDEAPTMAISGEVVSVDRVSVENNEMIVLGLKDESGAVRKVATGPSWFVLDPDNGIHRGAMVDATVVALGTDRSYGFAACDFETDDASVTLWTDDWKPAWRFSDDVADSSGLITATELIGMDARSNDDTAGEIQDGVLELGSGRLAMMLLDPNENLFGIADDLKCVPWSVGSVGMNRVHIDATTDTLKQCTAAPDDLTLISTPVSLKPIFEDFDVYVVEFEPRQKSDDEAKDRRDG